MCIDFNPRLREGGDIICIVGNSCIVNFNPRLREGGDKIDILFPPNKRYFNPRLREGGDLSKDNLHLHHSLLFQSTPPRRRRLQIPGAHIAFVDFNPRLREGGDKISNFSRYLKKGFQSTPPRRRRQHDNKRRFSK